MKRLLKLQKRRSTRKKSLKYLNKIFRIIKVRKEEMLAMNSPYNSSQYLIENASSPFFDEEDEFNIKISNIPNAILLLKKNENSKEESSVNSWKNSSFSTQNKSSIITVI